jgi:7-carboxy-7-deazaguanine synthase
MKINEIFSSTQGEGIYVGYRQLFIRFSSCHLSCDYCDEHSSDGDELSVDEVLTQLKSYSKQYHHSVSITGGEPLLQVDALKELLPNIELPKYLETSSTLPSHLAEIKNEVDIFALDYKPEYAAEFEESLKLVADEDTFVKFILLPSQHVQELKQASEIIEAYNRDIPFIIQPVTPHRKISHMPSEQEISAAYTIVKKRLSDVRVIPQTHKMLHIH